MLIICSTDFQTLIRLARSHARLQLRESINVCDALVAIMLMEESMAVRGNSKLKLLPCTATQADSLAILDHQVCTCARVVVVESI